MIIFQREIEDIIRKNLFKGSAVIIYGPRQSGKTTLSKKLVESFEEKGKYFDCELVEVRSAFVVGDPHALKALVGNYEIVVFDEAQTIENIGKILKVFHDTYPDVQVIATGSSSFDLSNKIVEPMTGRAIEYILPPLSAREISRVFQVDQKQLKEMLLYGSYPAIISKKTIEEKETELKKIATNYLYKDIFMLESIRNPKMFEDLLKMLAARIGSTVSVNELANGLKTTSVTVEKYIRLLEQSFVIKRIYSYSKNFSNELKKSFKIYFLDLGIRNVLSQSFLPIDDRTDKGAIFENYFIIEKYKQGVLETFPPSIYFWRTRQGLEIDLLVEKNNQIEAFECKYGSEDVVFNIFLKYYPGSKINVIRLSNVIQNLIAIDY
jgi:predicted AAA+ superfamily ATPase